MKKLFTTLMMVVVAFSFCNAQQDYKDFIKERKATAKFTKEQLKEKVTKDARKAAKQLKKEGWKTSPGVLPMDRQLDKSYNMQYEVDITTGFPKYIKGEATSIGGNYDAAKMQAINLAKTELAGNISTEVGALIESRVANTQMDKQEAASTANSVMASKNLIAQRVGQVITVIELYRDLPNGNKEVRVMVMYNADMAKAAAKQAIREDMDKRGDKLANKLDEILGY